MVVVWQNQNQTDSITIQKHVDAKRMTSGKCGIVTTSHGVGVIVRLPRGAGIRTVPLSSQEATVKEVTEKLTGQLKINGKLYVKVDNEAPRALKASEVLAKDGCYYFYPLP